jgi:hypothetical protein
MKKLVMIFLALIIMAMASGANAREHHHDWSNAPFDDGRWHRMGPVERHNMPFKWHERRDMHGNFRMERIYDERMDERFPGLRAYKWHAEHDRGFYYQGRYIRDSVMFYNDSDELVSVGFMRNGNFVVLRDDDRGYESRDDFFSSWLKVLLIHEIVNG